MAICDRCGVEVDDSAMKCPLCGRDLAGCHVRNSGHAGFLDRHQAVPVLNMADFMGQGGGHRVLASAATEQSTGRENQSAWR